MNNETIFELYDKLKMYRHKRDNVVKDYDLCDLCNEQLMFCDCEKTIALEIVNAIENKFSMEHILDVGKCVSLLSLLYHRTNIPFWETGIPSESEFKEAISSGSRFMKW